MALPSGTTGSLRPTFVPARPIGLAVKHPYTFTLDARLPTGLRVPLHSSVLRCYSYSLSRPARLRAGGCRGVGHFCRPLYVAIQHGLYHRLTFNVRGSACSL